MARCTVGVKTAMAQEKAFAFMADLTNSAQWDPGVINAVQVVGNDPGQGAAYDLTVKGVPRPLILRYHLTIFDPPSKLMARAESARLTSLDRIRVDPVPGGSVVTYDAELTLNGLLSMVNPLVGIAFGRIVDRAAVGLVRALDGVRIEMPHA